MLAALTAVSFQTTSFRGRCAFRAWLTAGRYRRLACDRYILRGPFALSLPISLRIATLITRVPVASIIAVTAIPAIRASSVAVVPMPLAATVVALLSLASVLALMTFRSSAIAAMAIIVISAMRSLGTSRVGGAAGAEEGLPHTHENTRPCALL
jgi:hypothetical protein